MDAYLVNRKYFNAILSELKGKGYCTDYMRVTEILPLCYAGLGSRGQVVEVKANQARNHLLLQDLAVYASPENLEKYASIMQEPSTEDQPSSPFALKVRAEIEQKYKLICP